ncbi:MAG: Rrf2 family transcriptional regulator [Planctomycetota bacterium]|jgi:Rrf2 family protein|nr:Rrf2 family transcriptional regulator [Planctomycetota bacterium]
MKFSTKSRYALRMMLDLIINSTQDSYVSLKDVSARQEISVKYLEQIVMQLTRAGLLKSSRGPQGGYMLARPASRYTPGDVIRCIEGRLAVVTCLESDPNPCRRAGFCSTLRFWQGLNQALNQYVDSMTLEEMADAYRRNIPLDFSI